MVMFHPGSQGIPLSSPTAWIAIGTVAIGCSFVLAIVHAALRARDDKRRLQSIEAALRNPNLTPETQRELVQALKPKPRRVGFTLGWLGAVSGIGWLCTEPGGDAFKAAVVLTVASFALVTLPFALRELDGRRA
jgi:hypothetical protein